VDAGIIPLVYNNHHLLVASTTYPKCIDCSLTDTYLEMGEDRHKHFLCSISSESLSCEQKNTRSMVKIRRNLRARKRASHERSHNGATCPARAPSFCHGWLLVVFRKLPNDALSKYHSVKHEIRERKTYL
jgi:hypothetical protein